MGLRQRARGRRPRVDIGEKFAGIGLQLLPQHGARLNPGHGRDAIEQAHQLIAVLLRDQVGAQGEELANLDKRWAEPFACDSVAQVQKNIDTMDRIQREVYPMQRGKSRRQAYPELAHSGQHYTRTWEDRHWDLQRVLNHLCSYALLRHVGPSGHLSIYNRRYYVGIVHRNQYVHVMFDPEQHHWLVVDTDGRLLNRLATKEITEQNIRHLEVNKKETRQGRSSRKKKNTSHPPSEAAKL